MKTTNSPRIKGLKQRLRPGNEQGHGNINTKNNENLVNKRKEGERRTQLATWNVRTMLKTGKWKEISEEIEKYNIEVACLQETRWAGNEILKNEKYTLYHSGAERQGKNGVAIAVKNTIVGNVLAFKPISDRMCYVKIKAKYSNLVIINVYAHTEEYPDAIKDAFYELLGETLTQLSAYDNIIIMGDMNAKIGKEQEILEICGKNSLHETTSNNGLRLHRFASDNDFKITSTQKPRKDIYKGTWRAPNGTVNQIDHVLIRRRRATCIESVQSMRGAECSTDHFLVRVKIRERIRAVRRTNGCESKRINVNKLQLKETREEYNAKVTEEFRKAHEQQTLESEWEVIKTAINDGAKQYLSDKIRSKTNEWCTPACEELIQEKKESMAEISTNKKRARPNRI